MNAWDHLPNAQHIDWVLATVKQHPKIWVKALEAAWDAAKGATRAATQAAAYDAARNAISGAARGAARGAAWNAIRGAARLARGAAWDAIRDAVWDAAGGAAWDAARDAIIALIAYDDCAHLLDMSSEQLKTWAVLSEQPAAVLLLSAVIARELIAQLETV
jgi:hypothetical protein